MRIYNLSKRLVSLGYDVKLVIPRNRECCENIDGVKVHAFKGFFPLRALKLISRWIGISKPTTLFSYDFSFICKASRIIRKSDIVQVEQQSAGGLLVPIAVKVFKKPVVVDCHDAFQALRVKNTNTLRRILETFVERIIYSYASAILVVSEKERQFLLSMGIGMGRIWVIPNGVDTKAFGKFRDTAEIRKRYGLTGYRTIVFVGNMEYPPNKEAVRLIALRIAPKVVNSAGEAKFLIIGRWVMPTYPNLIFTGVVDDVASILAASDIAIAPLYHGSGTRLKILEYFSSSLPVVSTTIGVEGLDVKDGIHVLIEDDLNVFASKVIQLLNDKQLSRQLGQSARELVVNNYDWNRIAGCLSKVYQNLLSRNW